MIDKIKDEYCYICRKLPNNNCSNAGCMKVEKCLKWAEELEKKLKDSMLDYMGYGKNRSTWDEEMWQEVKAINNRIEEAFHGGGK